MSVSSLNPNLSLFDPTKKKENSNKQVLKLAVTSCAIIGAVDAITRQGEQHIADININHIFAGLGTLCIAGSTLYYISREFIYPMWKNITNNNSDTSPFRTQNIIVT